MSINTRTQSKESKERQEVLQLIHDKLYHTNNVIYSHAQDKSIEIIVPARKDVYDGCKDVKKFKITIEEVTDYSNDEWTLFLLAAGEKDRKELGE